MTSSIKMFLAARGKFSPRVIFDVGANRGQSCDVFRHLFDTATIFAFEPSTESFELLRERYRDQQNVLLHNFGLSSEARRAAMTIGKGVSNSVVVNCNEQRDYEYVELIRGDAFCCSSHVDSIDYLKIDAEGHDLDVLFGFEDMLASRKITAIEVECTTSLKNRFHCQLSDIIQYLDRYDYHVFGIYEFRRGIARSRQRLDSAWFCNAVFMRERTGIVYP